MGGTGYLSELAFGMVYVLVFLCWGISVALVYTHASTHDRSTWFWVLVAVIPVAGVIFYFVYFYYKENSILRNARTRHKERTGERIAKPRTPEQLETHDAIASLAKFRDREVERLILERNMDEVFPLIEKRVRRATMCNDFIAVESYDVYRRAADRVDRTSELPRIMKILYDIPDKACLDSRREPDVPAIGPPVESVAEEEPVEGEEPPVFKDEQSWLEFGD